METIKNCPFFAEIIESSLQQWTSQSWKWSTRPNFSSLMVVQNGDHTIFGAVCTIETSSGQTDRKPFPYQKTEEELLREQPHIFEFLQTTFTCLTLGYKEAEKGILYHYAPQPPKIHAFVRPASIQESALFFSDDSYLSMLFAHRNELYNIDELLLGLLRIRIESCLLTREQLNSFIESFSLHTGNDYRRLKLFLQRIQPLIKEQTCLIS